MLRAASVSGPLRRFSAARLAALPRASAAAAVPPLRASRPSGGDSLRARAWRLLALRACSSARCVCLSLRGAPSAPRCWRARWLPPLAAPYGCALRLRPSHDALARGVIPRPPCVVMLRCRALRYAGPRCPIRRDPVYAACRVCVRPAATPRRRAPGRAPSRACGRCRAAAARVPPVRRRLAARARMAPASASGCSPARCVCMSLRGAPSAPRCWRACWLRPLGAPVARRSRARRAPPPSLLRAPL